MKTKNKNHDEAKTTAPIFAADCGRVRGSVWKIEENGATRYKVTLTRSFRQENGEWTRGRTFFRGELSAIVEVTGRVQRWIERQEREASAQLQLLGT